MAPEDRIKEKVYAGKVLDERGMWISLDEKLKKERAFQKHLEKGEILSDGKWTHISKIRLQQEQHADVAPAEEADPAVEEETTIVSIRKEKNDGEDQADAGELLPMSPEETVSFSMDTIQDFSVDNFQDEGDFPPETTVFKIDRTGETAKIILPGASGKTVSEKLANGETQMDIPVNPVAANQTEFEETVLYNINMLKKDPDSGSSFRLPKEKPSASGRSAFHDSILQSHNVELQRQKNRNRITAAFIIALVLGVIFLVVKTLM